MRARKRTSRIGPGGDRWLIVGAVVSLLTHVVVVSWLIGASASAGEGDGGQVLQTADGRRPATPPEVRLGLVDLDRVSINWLGFETPTEEHVAPSEAETEQAAMTPNPVGGPAGSAPTPPAPEQTEPESPEDPTRAAQAQPEPAEADPDKPTSLPPASVPVVPETPELGPPVPAPQASAPAKDPEPEAAAPTPNPKPQPPGSGGNGDKTGTGSGEDPGLAADRESTNVALEKTLDIKDWTNPVVGEGVRIKTVRPQTFIHFAGIRFPRPAVLEIHFKRHGEGGVVTKAAYLQEKRPDGSVVTHTTGDPVLDALVLDAVYRWTAEGKAIDALGPEQELVVQMRFSWVR